MPEEHEKETDENDTEPDENDEASEEIDEVTLNLKPGKIAFARAYEEGDDQ